MRKRIFVLSVMVAFMALFLVAGCGSDDNSPVTTDNGLYDPADPGNGSITVTIDPNGSQQAGNVMTRALLTPPGPYDVWAYGDAVVPGCYEPACGVQWTTASGVINEVLTIPYWTDLVIAYSYLYNRIDNISLNAGSGPEILTNFMTYDPDNDPTTYNDVPLACFKVNKDTDPSGNVTIEILGDQPGDTVCAEVMYTLRLRVTGDDNANGVADPPYDHPQLPFDGTQTIWFQTSLFGDPTIFGTLAWDAGASAYTEILPSIGTNQHFWIHVSRPYIGPINPPPTDPQPVMGGVFIDVMNGAVIVGTIQVVNMVDAAPALNVMWPSAMFTGVAGGNSAVNEWCNYSVTPAVCDNTDNRGNPTTIN